MGQGYIDINSKGQRMPITGKVQALVNDGATILDPNDPGVVIEVSPTTVIVVENAHFDAAMIVDEDYRMQRVLNAKLQGDPRPTTWLHYPHAQATVTR
jgi:hypothetical protein